MQRILTVVLLMLATASGTTYSERAQGQRDSTAAPQAATGTMSIAGHVVLGEGATTSPVRRARVTLTADGTFPAQVTDTDTDGAFRFDRLPAGTFRLLAEKPGFILQERGPSRAAVRPLMVTLTDAPVANLNVVMQRAAAIEGQLLGDNGEPAANIVVSAVRLAYGAYGRRPVAVRQATTDDMGRFRVHTLPSGEYYVEAAPDPLYGITTTLPADRMGFARSYYPGTARTDEARVVSVAPGQEVSAIDFRLGAVRLTNVSGTIATSGRPAAIGFRMQRVGGAPGDIRCLAPRPGEFSCPAVAPGDYWLLGTTRLTPSADPEYAAVRIIVTGDDQKPLTLTTDKGAPVTGRIEVEGGAALPANLRVIAAETDYELPQTQPPPPATEPAPGAVAADGTFALPSVFGPRLFRVDRLPPNWVLKSVLLDGTDVTDTPVDFLASSKPRTLRVVLTSRTASIGGTLEAPTGGPTTGRMVVFSDDPRRWGIRSRVNRTVEVQADGRYAITGLLAGRYYIVGVEGLDDLAWFDPEVLSRLQATATPITLSEGQRVTLSLVRR